MIHNDTLMEILKEQSFHEKTGEIVIVAAETYVEI